VSVALSDCACGCTKVGVPPASPLGEKRDSPPPHHEGRVSPPGSTSNASQNDASEETIQRQGLYKDCQLPSGLSVEDEDEPELETTVF
jgi:hypothetical protein